MAVRGVYTEEEKKLLEEWMRVAERGHTWLRDEPILGKEYMYHPVMYRTATNQTIVDYAKGIGDYNPLWCDERYARYTRWGSIVAPPFFPQRLMFISRPSPEINHHPSAGIFTELLAGNTWRWFKHIKADDSFRVRVSKLLIEDKTRKDGTGNRMFMLSSEYSFVNQRDELVCKAIGRMCIFILPHPEKGKEASGTMTTFPRLTEYRYTKEELDFIDHIGDEEEIRGANPRYWEDVNVGEEIKPVVLGPITLYDMINTKLGGSPGPYMRVLRKMRPGQHMVLDPVTGVWHNMIEHHYSDHIAQLMGEPVRMAFGNQLEETAGRLITNWMGDDGFLKMYNGSDRQVALVGDTVFGRGKVIKKYVENGEHLVDLVIWEDVMSGYIVHSGTATVSLPSRDEAF